MSLTIKAKLRPRVGRLVARALEDCHDARTDERGAHMISSAEFEHLWAGSSANELAHLIVTNIRTTPELQVDEVAHYVLRTIMHLKQQGFEDVNQFVKELTSRYEQGQAEPIESFEFVAPIYIPASEPAELSFKGNEVGIVGAELSSTKPWIIRFLRDFYEDQQNPSENWEDRRGVWTIRVKARSRFDAFSKVATVLEFLRGAFSLSLISLPTESPYAGPFGMQRPWVPERVPYLHNVDYEDNYFLFHKAGISDYNFGSQFWDDVVRLFKAAGECQSSAVLQERLAYSVMAWARSCDSKYPDERFFGYWNAVELLCSPAGGSTDDLTNRVSALLRGDLELDDDLRCFAALRNDFVHRFSWRGDESALTMRFGSIAKRCILRYADLLSELTSDEELQCYFEFAQDSNRSLRLKRDAIDKHIKARRSDN